VRGELRNAVGETHGQARNTFAGRLTHLVEQRLADLKNLLRAVESGLAGLGHGDTAPRRFQQLSPNRFFQFAHLRAYRLDGHVEPLGRAREAAFLYDDPEIIKMAIVQHGRRHFEESDMWFSLSLLYPNSWGNDDIYTHHARLSVRCPTFLRSNAMKCPVCKTTDLLMTERRSIEIDYCPDCRGVWLDRGELDKLISDDDVERA
jgi:hypothetical protein